MKFKIWEENRKINNVRSQARSKAVLLPLQWGSRDNKSARPRQRTEHCISWQQKLKMYVSWIFTLLLTFNFLPVLSIIIAIKQYYVYKPWGEQSVKIVGAPGTLRVSSLSSAFSKEKCRATGIKGWKLKWGKEQGKQQRGEGKVKRFHGERMSSRVIPGRKGRKDEIVRGKNRY